ncbi:MAG: HEAT repeat domain-containing protein, partial [Armatimonadetes bacterium]|nr:HEAT repeat domain-containing protein [Armatimonadota bacterium]
MDPFVLSPMLWVSIVLGAIGVGLTVLAGRHMRSGRSDVKRFLTLLRASDPAARAQALERTQALPAAARARLARALHRDLGASRGEQSVAVWFIRQILSLLTDARQEVRSDAARVLGAVMGRGAAQLLSEDDREVALAPAVAAAVELAGGRLLTQSEAARSETRVLALAEMLDAGLRPLVVGLKQLSGVEDEAMEPLSSALRDRSPGVRRSLVEVFAAMGGDRSVEMLRRLLQDPSPDLRAEAARALGNLRAEEAANDIAGLLMDPVGEVRAAAARALAALEQGETIDTILAALNQESQRDEPSERAREALIEVTVQVADAARPLLADTLDRLPRPVARRLALALDQEGVIERWLRAGPGEPEQEGLARLLARLAALGVSAPLLAALDSTIESVRIQAAAALGHSRDGAAVGAISGLLSDPDAAVRAAAVRALSASGEPAVLEPLSQAAADPSGMVKLAAALGLGEVMARRDQWRTDTLPPEFDSNVALRNAQRALLTASGDPLSEVRRAAVGGLQWFPSAEAADALASLALDDGDEAVRGEAATGLETCAFPQKRRLVAGALEDPDSNRRARAVSLLTSVGGPDIPRQIVEALDDPSDIVRTAALAALSRANLTDVADALATHLKSRDPKVRACVANELGRARTTEAVGALVHALTDPDEDVRVAAVGALSQMGRSVRRHEPALAARRSDPSLRVREATAAALNQLRSSWSQAAEATELFRQGPLSESAADALVEMAASGDADPLLRTLGEQQANVVLAQMLSRTDEDKLGNVLSAFTRVPEQERTR